MEYLIFEILEATHSQIQEPMSSRSLLVTSYHNGKQKDKKEHKKKKGKKLIVKPQDL